jgi:hypothetical protein
MPLVEKIATRTRLVRVELESSIEDDVRDLATYFGGFAYKLDPVGRYDKPDQLMIMPQGLAVFVECKRPGGVARDAQLREHERIRRRGHVCIVVSDTKDIATLKRGIAKWYATEPSNRGTLRLPRRLMPRWIPGTSSASA